MTGALEQLLHGFMGTQVIHTAVRSGILDALGSDPAEADSLAHQLGGDPAAVLRLLRGMVVLGLASVGPDGRFAATGLAAQFRADAPGSFRDAALFRGGAVYRAWGELTAAVVAGECPYQRAMGVPLWEYMAANPEENAVFNGAMRGMSSVVAQGLVQTLDVNGSTVMDIGGGHGHLVAALLEANPDARGIVFDQPALEPEVRSFLAERNLAGRCRFAGGDFFRSLPDGADVHVMKWILHDWSDEDCLAILRSSRTAVADEGRLVIVERPLPELDALAASSAPAVMGDLMMLAVFGPGSGQERTEAEYGALLTASGFSLRERLPLSGGFAALVASPA